VRRRFIEFQPARVEHADEQHQPEIAGAGRKRALGKHERLVEIAAPGVFQGLLGEIGERAHRRLLGSGA
jgi:hypothetical protein